MRVNLKAAVLLSMVFVVFLLLANVALAQDDGTPKKRLHSPAKVHGFIGGEAHDSYVIRARKGQIMTVEISWKHAKGQNAEFVVSRSANFFNGDPVKFGAKSNGGKRWSGKVPATRDYYIYVVAHPSAKYTLRVMLKRSI